MNVRRFGVAAAVALGLLSLTACSTATEANAPTLANTGETPVETDYPTTSESITEETNDSATAHENEEAPASTMTLSDLSGVWSGMVEGHYWFNTNNELTVSGMRSDNYLGDGPFTWEVIGNNLVKENRSTERCQALKDWLEGQGFSTRNLSPACFDGSTEVVTYWVVSFGHNGFRDTMTLTNRDNPNEELTFFDVEEFIINM